MTRMGLTRQEVAESKDAAATNEHICAKMSDTEGTRYWRAQREVCEEMLNDWPEAGDAEPRSSSE